MGLDSIWYIPGETSEDGNDKLPYFDPELKLITGILFDCPRSFRGKKYNDLVVHVANVDLYQEEIPNAKVKEIAEYFDLVDPTIPEVLDEIKQHLGYKTTDGEALQQFNDLKRMFRAYADAGAILHGWW